jgi:hypothetical protein
MLQGKPHRRIIAATLLTIMLTNTLAPTVSYALTSGPTQPEATSFEPVDTSDMINLQSGDFTYNIPLLEVPGPEGGYPLSLSYHAGIQPNEDASWVGLGWSLNPGAINRSVNGLPDDWKGIQGSNRGYWSGGSQTNANFGVNVGVAGTPFNVSFGLSYSNDTYKGVGIGFNVGIGAATPFGPSLNFGIGKGPYDDKASFSKGMAQTISMGSGPFSFGITAETNFKTVNADAFGGIYFGGGLGASMSSSGGKGVSLGGLSGNFSSGEEHGVQTSSRGLQLTLPITNFLTVSLGFKKTRYWSDETTTMLASGSLFPYGENFPNTNNFYDNYSLLEDPAERDMVANPDASVLQGGTYPDYDAYNVTAQGLGGSIRPYKVQGYLMGQPRKGTVGNTPNMDILTYPFVNNAPLYQYEETGFRFINDFSNSYRQDYNAYPDMSQDLITAATVPFDMHPDYGNNDGNKGAYPLGSDVRVVPAGSKHIDLGLKINPVNCQGYNPGERYRTGMVKGFSITNESGVNYHYGLPAYSYAEENYQEKVNTQKGLYFNRGDKPGAYAYTWYLTTITGPDYVDRNNNAIADNGDWGYWVNFEYGKWSNNYTWRNPSEGYHRDEDNAWQNCSMGKREVYYLNAIRTRTHAALFEKDVRYDAKGASNNINGKINGKEYNNDGGFGVRSAQSLKLSRIYLVNAADADLVHAYEGGSNPYYHYDVPYDCTDCQLPENVLDRTDLEVVGQANLESKSIRVIDLVYDYSLCPKTANSFRPFSPDEKFGKLTLKQLNLRGRQGVSLMPPSKFEYELSGNEVKSQAGVTMGSYYFMTSNGNFEAGEMINRSDGAFGGIIVGKSFINGNWYYWLINNSYTGVDYFTTNVVTTKNPPYNKDAYDAWGMYKGDVISTVLSSNENMGRTTTQASGRAADAWCLRKMTSPLGDAITLKYESDTYKKPVMDNSASFVMKNLSVESNNQTISFQLENYSSTIDPMATPVVGSRFPRVILMASMYDGFIGTRSKRTLASQGGLTVTAVNGSTITGNLDVPITQVANYTMVTGNIWVDQNTVNTDFYGGGLRVTSLTINHSIDNTSSSVLYNYNNAAGRSSGVTSYAPTLLDVFDAAAVFANPNNDHGFLEWDAWKYKSALYKNVNSVYPLARELPPPGVLYEYVTVTNQVKNPDEANARNIEGSTMYQFEVFRDNMVNREEVNPLQTGTSSGNNGANTPYARNWALRKFTSSIGNVRKITQLDKDGAKLSETTNNFLHDGLEGLSFHDFMAQYKSRLDQYEQKYHYQGFLQERYFELKKVYLGGTNPYAPQGPLAYNPGTNVNGIKATMSAREEYPCIPTTTTVVNYANGITTSSEILAFDFYSGVVTKKVETDGYGNRFMTETVPAYTKYDAMGLKINNSNQKNMLTQVAATYLYKVNVNNAPVGLVSAAVQTWGNETPVLDKDGNVYTQNTTGTTGDVWRMQSTYNWMPVNKTNDNITASGDFSDFVWNAPATSHANWKKTGQVTLYDVYSKELEGMDMNGNFSTTRMTYDSKKTELTGGPANYYEIAYSGAEDEGVNQANNLFVKKADGVVTTNTAHTGVKSLQLGVNGKKGLVYTVSTNKLVAGRNYIASVWVKPVTGVASDVKLYYDINGVVKANPSSAASSRTANGWTLVVLNINGADITTGQTLTVGCRNDHGTVDAYVDDLRFQPLGAATTAYVYDPLTGQLTYVLNNSNLYTAYEYDAAGRLIKTFGEKIGTGKIKVSEYQYNMGQALYVAPVIVYTKLVYNFNYTDPVDCEKTHYWDVYIKFFSDAACTNSLNVTNLTVKYNRQASGIPGYTDGYYGETVNTGSTPVDQVYLGTMPLLYQNFCNFNPGVMTYEMEPGDYIIKEPAQPQLPQLYAKLIKIYGYSDFTGCKYEDYYHVAVEFFWDAACTVEASVNYMGIPYMYNNVPYNISVQSTFLHSVTLPVGSLHVTDYCEGTEYDVPMELTYSSNYIIVY